MAGSVDLASEKVQVFYHVVYHLVEQLLLHEVEECTEIY